MPLLTRDLRAFVWAMLSVLALQLLIQACQQKQLRAARSAADAICRTAQAWETDLPEVATLRELCGKTQDLEQLHQQFNVCVLKAQAPPAE